MAKFYKLKKSQCDWHSSRKIQTCARGEAAGKKGAFSANFRRHNFRYCLNLIKFSHSNLTLAGDYVILLSLLVITICVSISFEKNGFAIIADFMAILAKCDNNHNFLFSYNFCYSR